MADADSPELIAAINRLTETVAATAGAGGGVGSGISREELEAIRTGDTEREKSLKEQRQLMGDISNTANLMGSYFGNITDEITGSSAGIENMVRGIDRSIVSAVKLVKQFKFDFNNKSLDKTINSNYFFAMLNETGEEGEVIPFMSFLKK